MSDNDDNFAGLNDPESMALKQKLMGRQQQMSAEEMKKDGNVLDVMRGKVEEIKGRLNERSADADLKKISEEKMTMGSQTGTVI